LWPELPATSLSFCATSAPARRSNSWEALSPLATVTGALENTVFTYTQLVKKMPYFFACIKLGSMIRLCMFFGRVWV
jgi:hypothetical protein